MRLTKSVDFSMRVLIHLARQNTSVTMPVLSKSLCVPYNHLSKLVQILRKAGYIETYQGKFGGVKLLRDPAEITMAAIVELIEGPTYLADCLDKRQEACIMACSCKLKAALRNVEDIIYHSLDGIKVADMV